MQTKERRAQLEKLRAGDLQSFRWVYDQQQAKVYGFCLKLLGSPVVAEEITSDVFVRLWEKRSIIDPAQPVGPLLFKITRDFSWNYLKKASRQAKHLDRYTSERTASTLARAEDDLVLTDYFKIAESAIDRLPDRQRQVFNLRYRSGLDNAQIAARLGIAETTVRVQLSKASRFLRGFLKSHPELLFVLMGLAESTQ